MNHLESPPNLSLSLRKFWSCNQLRRKLMIEGVLIILWLIYLKSLKSNECQIGFWTFLRKCMRLINISSWTQPWTQAVRRVLAFLESHTWTFFAYNFNPIRQWSIQWFCWLQLNKWFTFLPCSPWCRILCLSGCLGRTPSNKISIFNHWNIKVGWPDPPTAWR